MNDLRVTSTPPFRSSLGDTHQSFMATTGKEGDPLFSTRTDCRPSHELALYVIYKMDSAVQYFDDDKLDGAAHRGNQA